VRLIGVSLAGLGEVPPPGLFDDAGPADGDVLIPFDRHENAVDRDEGSTAAATTAAPRPWRAGDDVTHSEFGHGWVQGAGHGRVTVRFETRTTGPGRARTLAADDPALSPAHPAGSLA
jgi:DNA polymerase-4